jgi:hypothetical protein
LALLTIFKYIVAGGNAAVQHLTAILTRSSSLDAAHIMSEILQLWLQYVDMREAHELLVEQTRLVTFNGDWVQSLNSFDPVLHSAPLLEETVCCHKKSLFFSKILKKQPSIHPFNDTALSSIIHFIIFAAKQSITLQRGLLDAGALAVVLIAFVDGVPILSNLLDTFKHLPSDRQSKHNVTSYISLSSIRTEASKLLDMIQTPAFQVLLKTRIFTKRRRICLPLLDALLGLGGGVDDEYSDLRDILIDILT